ncbi:type II toxin-antitoxin system VapC family toxin [Tundrisphaera sp. TA3]|uniref:type II toxin-antitoxin system VapC family toxin n=1 Tax=Tundrisphaera sp. TA3 TaxID=3435775 RepID=UPI003EBBCBC9
MKVLLDTNILAELVKPGGHPGVIDAVRNIPSPDLFLSVLTVGEIVKGIALLAPCERKTALANWLVKLELQYSDRILSIDVETSRIWGEMTARAQKAGVIIPSSDGLLAATALRHGLHVMTRNTRHFEASGAFLIDSMAGGVKIRRGEPGSSHVSAMIPARNRVLNSWSPGVPSDLAGRARGVQRTR